ncbi:universal stress protein [Halogeometricum luteum]|uniref:Universal stress protein n=1 Tax=Halogeometricum luteum TaxID=2950537 RepID=A0ABU2G6I0_9EURY|nr:universal stress protein [Halogeometricum sp. S3BR5-2]MDS0296410.1 universal stress protein [Halogeometricum sp. S3BR5-2]
MGEHVLVPFDGSPLSERALDRVLTRHPEDDVTVLYVVDPLLAVYEGETKGLGAGESWSEWMTARTDAIRADAEERAAERGRTVTVVVESGRPGRVVLAYVDDHDVDHVVMGSHGRSGVPRLVLGSVAERVMRESTVPVTVVR